MENGKTQFTLLILGLFFILISCNKSVEHQNDEITNLLEADKDWAESAATNDFKKMISHFDTAAIGIYGTQILKGHSDLEPVWKRLMESPVYYLKWEVQGAEVSGNLGFTYGPWEQRRIIHSDTIVEKGIYLATWKKQSNGDWKVLIDKP